jgi:hypothetical protein
MDKKNSKAEEMISFLTSKEFLELSEFDQKKAIREFARYVKNNDQVAVNMIAVNANGNETFTFKEFIDNVGEDEFTDIIYEAIIQANTSGGLIKRITIDEMAESVTRINNGTATKEDKLVYNVAKKFVDTEGTLDEAKDMTKFCKTITDFVLNIARISVESTKYNPGISDIIFSTLIIGTTNSMINDGYFKKFETFDGNDDPSNVLNFLKSVSDQIYDVWHDSLSEEPNEEVAAYAFLYKAFELIMKNNNYDIIKNYNELFKALDINNHIEEAKKFKERIDKAESLLQKNGSNKQAAPTFDNSMFDDEPEENDHQSFISDFIKEESKRDMTNEEGKNFLKD